MKSILVVNTLITNTENNAGNSIIHWIKKHRLKNTANSMSIFIIITRWFSIEYNAHPCMYLRILIINYNVYFFLRGWLIQLYIKKLLLLWLFVERLFTYLTHCIIIYYEWNPEQKSNTKKSADRQTDSDYLRKCFCSRRSCL